MLIRLLCHPLIASWLIAGFVIDLVYLAINHIEPSAGIGAPFLLEIEIFPGSYFITLIIMIPAFILIGYPASVLLRKLELVSISSFLTVGISVGTISIIFFAFILSLITDQTFHGHLIDSFQSTKVVAGDLIGGGAAGCVYWISKFCNRSEISD